MSQANVEDIEAVKLIRLSLQKFQESALISLSEAEGDLVRTTLWLDTEQTPYWNLQVKKCTDKLSQAQEQLRMKKLFKDSTGSKPSTVDEEKAVKIAKMRLEEAQRKVVAVKQWKRKMEKVANDYRGSVQRFSTTVQSALPATIAKLEVMVRQLEQYVGFRPAEAASAAGEMAVGGGFESEAAGSMVRGDVDLVPEEPKESKPKTNPDTVESH